VCQVLVR